MRLQCVVAARPSSSPRSASSRLPAELLQQAQGVTGQGAALETGRVKPETPIVSNPGSLVVGGVGIMNIMLVSVTERTREIGIRLAIGALAREVQLQFLTEAVVLCCFGFALSYSLASLLNFQFIFDPGINILSFVVSALIGIVFGYFPARRASQLDPIEALRHE